MPTAINAAHLSVAINGDIRWTGPNSGTTYSWLDLHRFLGDLMDDAEAAGDDLADITTDTISVRSTDQIISLNSPFNIDDTLARFFFDGSLEQNNGDDLYSGLEFIGPVQAGTEPIVLQDDKILPAYWATGINPISGSSTFMRLSIKTREGGADIDGKRVTVLARELGDSYREFPATLGFANSVAAIANGSDLNNTTADATIEGWTTITNTEGWQELDIDGTGATGQEFYSQWAIGTQTINDTYERTKWITQRAATVDSNAEVGENLVVDNGTIVGQGMEFVAGLQAEKLVEVRVKLKIGGGAPSGPITIDLIDSDDAAPAAPVTPFTVLATSEPVLASLITATYQEIIFRFEDNVSLTANQTYFIVARHPNGNATDFFHVEYDSTSGAVGNTAAESPAGTWTGVASSGMNFAVKTSPLIHTRAGERFRGIDLGPIAHDAASGNFIENEVLYWGATYTYDGLTGSFTVGEYVTFETGGLGGSSVNGGKVLADSGTVLTIALEDITGGLVIDNDGIRGVDSGATALVNVTIADDTAGGGEGLLLAFDDDGVVGNFYIQLLTGVAPINNLQMNGRTSGFNALVNITVTSRTISPAFIGQSTGSNLIGAYGIGFTPADVGSSDTFFDLANAQRVPPNNVVFTVAGLISGEDRVIVGPRTGIALEKGQFLVSTALTGAAETAIVIKTGVETAPIGLDTPQDGNTLNTRLRVQLDNGVYKRQPYLSYLTSTFTIAATDYSGAGVGAAVNNNVFIAYIDVLAVATTATFTGVYQADRSLFGRVRDGGATPIVTFEATGAQFLSTPQTITAIRNSDA